jgi:hypothetical protein
MESTSVLIGSNIRETNSIEANNNNNNNYRYYSLDESNSNYNINNNNNNNNNNYDYSFNSQSNGYYVNNNGDLIIKNINFKNQGWFKCEASNLLGSVSANMFLQVKSKLKFFLLILFILVVTLKFKNLFL